MARTFTNGSSTWLYNTASAPVTAEPLTLACWFMATGDVFQALVNVMTSASNNQRFSLNVQDTASGKHVTAQSRNTSNAIAVTSTTWTGNVWQHACAVFSASNSRTAYLNGGGKATETTSNVLNAPNSVYIGSTGLSTGAFTGRIAEVGIWNVALTDGEVLALASGISPLRIRPTGLVFYAPIHGIASPEPDYSGGGRHLTLNGSLAVANHAPVQPPFIWQVPSHVGTTVVSGTTYNESLSLGAAGGVSVAPAVDVAGALTLGAGAAVSEGPASTLPTDLSLAQAAALSADGGLRTADSLTLAQAAAVTASLDLTLNPTLALAAGAAVTEGVTADYVDQVDLGAGAGASLSSSVPGGTTNTLAMRSAPAPH